jgi:tetratricopeptide (TPR) repeat protein
MEILVSPASFAQKQAAWNGLKNAGQLDQAIHELEQRMANDPQRPEYVAALGEAYMKKCATMTDVREQAILAMQADKTLEKASIWIHRTGRRVSPSRLGCRLAVRLNKSPQVVHEFLTLIQQEERQPKEPQSRSHIYGSAKEYKKAGQAENALQIWQRGAALFPENKELQTKSRTTSESPVSMNLYEKWTRLVVWTSRSPSPRPSPLGRGSPSPRALKAAALCRRFGYA